MAKRGTQITIAMLIAAGVAIPAASFASGGSGGGGGGGGGGTSGRSTLPPATVVTEPVTATPPATDAPTVPTDAPTVPTDAPTPPTDAPTVPTDAPTPPTGATTAAPTPPTDVTTAAPTPPTEVTTLPPAPPVEVTPAPAPAPAPTPAPVPAPAPVVKADSLKVTKAYTNATATTAGQMLIKASSSNPKARLFAYRPDGTLIGEVVNGGGSRYGGTVMPIQMYDPASITIRSSMGGSITVPTTAFKI